MKLFFPFIAAFFFGLFQPLFATDLDRDGMDDFWQSLYNVAPFTGSLDPDNDGRLNLVEAINASHPNDTAHPDTSWGVVSITDINADLLDDGWAVTHMRDNTPLLPGDDPDSDGRKNIEESITSSNPWVADNPVSNAADTPGVAAGGLNEFQVRVSHSIPTMRYRLQVSDDLIAWNYDTSSTSTFWGNGSQRTVTVPVPGLTSRFYRFVIDDPDLDQDGLSGWMEYVLGTSDTTTDSNGDGINDLDQYMMSTGGSGNGGNGGSGVGFLPPLPSADILVVRDRYHSTPRPPWSRTDIISVQNGQSRESDLIEAFGMTEPHSQEEREAAASYRGQSSTSWVFFWHRFTITAQSQPEVTMAPPAPIRLVAIVANGDQLMAAGTVTCTFPSSTSPARIVTTINPGFEGILTLATPAGEEGGILEAKLGPNEFVNTTTFLDLLPLEIMQPAINTDGSAGEFEPVTEIRPTRWLDAFQGNSFENLYDDRDRVQFSFPSYILPHDVNQTPIEIKLGVNDITGTSTGETTDTADSIILPGEQIIDVSFVTDAVDDDEYNGPFANEDADWDTTHLCSLGASAKLELTGMGLQHASFEIPILRPLGKVELSVRVMSATGSLEPDVLAKILKDCQVAREIYAQIGVEVTALSIAGMPLDPQVVGLLADEMLSLVGGSSFSDYHQILQTLPNNTGSTKIPVYYFDVAIIEESGGVAGGVTYPWNHPSKGGLIMISLPNKTNATLAHEMGHALGIRVHAPVLNHRLMKTAGTFYLHHIGDSKRFTWEEEKTIRSRTKFYVPLR